MSIKRILKAFVSRMIPSKTIATCFGIGLLPEWSRHWASVFGSIVCIAYIGITAGELHDSIFEISKVNVLVEMASTLATFAIISYLVGMIAKIFYSFRDAEDTENEDFYVIDAFNGIVLMCAVSMIAIFSIRNVGVVSTNYICKNFLLCNGFFIHLFYSILPVCIPFGLFRMFDTFKIWPCNKLSETPTTALLQSLDTIISVFYTTFCLYLLAFIFFDLDVISMIIFMKAFYYSTLIKVINVLSVFDILQEHEKIYAFFRDIGIIGVLNNFGIVDIHKK